MLGIIIIVTLVTQAGQVGDHLAILIAMVGAVVVGLDHPTLDVFVPELD
jgi:hypothetical protein